jgi:hypothetical protein
MVRKMSETVAVALVSGGIAGVVGLIGALLAYRSAKNQGQVSLSVANQAAQVELEGMRVENERLREQRREEKRDHRQDAYHQLLDIATKLYRKFGVRVEQSASEDLLEEYNRLIAGLLLYAPDAVRDRAYDLNDIVGDAWTGVADQDSSLTDAEKWEKASRPHKERVADAINALVEVMRDDIVVLVEGDRPLNPPLG